MSLVPVAKAEGFISPQKGMEIPSGDGNNYVYTELGKFELSNYCACGLRRFINNMDYYYSQEPVVFLLDSTDRVIGAIEVPEDEVEFSGSAKPMTDAEKKLLAEKKHQQEIDKAVRYLLANGIMFGRPESFDRDAKVTNAMVWAVLARMSGYRPTEDGSTWYSFYQHWAVTKCISDGKDPNGAVTREAFIKMVYNAAKAKEVSEIPDLNDYGEVSRDAQAAVRWAAHHGVIPAKGNSFKPKSALTRGEMALMLVAADKCL